MSHDLEGKIKGLKKEIELMKTCYCKGFGNAIQHILSDVEYYCTHFEKEVKNENLLKTLNEHLIKTLNKLEKFYQNIPFQQLNSNTDFAPLFVIKELLPKYSEMIQKVIKEPKEESIKDVDYMSKMLVDIGRLYYFNFITKENKLREMPGYEKFRIDLFTCYNIIKED